MDRQEMKWWKDWMLNSQRDTGIGWQNVTDEETNKQSYRSIDAIIEHLLSIINQVYCWGLFTKLQKNSN